MSRDPKHGLGTRSFIPPLPIRFKKMNFIYLSEKKEKCLSGKTRLSCIKITLILKSPWNFKNNT